MYIKLSRFAIMVVTVGISLCPCVWAQEYPFEEKHVQALEKIKSTNGKLQKEGYKTILAFQQKTIDDLLSFIEKETEWPVGGIEYHSYRNAILILEVFRAPEAAGLLTEKIQLVSDAMGPLGWHSSVFQAKQCLPAVRALVGIGKPAVQYLIKAIRETSGKEKGGGQTNEHFYTVLYSTTIRAIVGGDAAIKYLEKALAEEKDEKVILRLKEALRICKKYKKYEKSEKIEEKREKERIEKWRAAHPQKEEPEQKKNTTLTPLEKVKSDKEKLQKEGYQEILAWRKHIIDDLVSFLEKESLKYTALGKDKSLIILMQILAEFRAPEASEVLVKNIGVVTECKGPKRWEYSEKNVQQCLPAAKALVKIGKPAVPALIEAIKKPEEGADPVLYLTTLKAIEGNKSTKKLLMEAVSKEKNTRALSNIKEALKRLEEWPKVEEKGNDSESRSKENNVEKQPKETPKNNPENDGREEKPENRLIKKQEPNARPAEEQTEQKADWLLPGIIVVVIVLAGVVIFLLLRRKK